MPSLFIFGITGYVSSRLIEQLKGTEFEEISGTSTKPSSSSLVRVYPLTAEGKLSNEAIQALSKSTHILSTVPTNNDTTLNDHLVETLSKQGKIEWVGYLSTTATYGDRSLNDMVTEDDTEKEPTKLSERGRARLIVEEKWRRTGAPIHIFRLPGIYGPGRGPLTKARGDANRLIYKENHVFCRVHVDDICQVLLLSMRKPNPGRIYNVCDDEPAPSHVVSLFAYSLLKKTPPPLTNYSDMELSPMLKSFYSESRKITNLRAKLELGFVPKYPTYQEGLVSQFEEENRTNQSDPFPVGSSLPVVKFSSPNNQFKFFFYRLKVIWGILLMKLKFLINWVRFQIIKRNCTILLVDNGSVRPGATLGMRRLAKKLMEERHMPTTIATSWKHADEIKTLPDNPPMLFKDVILTVKTRYVIILPLFLGPSSIVTKELPKLLFSSFQKIAKPLVDLSEEEIHSCRISEILLRNVDKSSFSNKTRIILVDHGSPSREVNRVRRALAARLRALCYPATVVDCSMERREGKLYDFNEPLLENVFDRFSSKDNEDNQEEVIVVPAFLFPGKHAGEDGDIENIIKEKVKGKYPKLKIKLMKILLDEANDQISLQLLESRIRSSFL